MTTTTKTILVPGAWMGAWCWEPTAQQLIDRGFDVETLTLSGMEVGKSNDEISVIRLEDHVSHLAQFVTKQESRVVLVSHSYSGMVTAQVADRVGDKVLGQVHFGSFLPIHDRSLIDDWGESQEERDQEKADIVEAGNLWMAPTREMLDYIPDLSDGDKDHLANKFTPHPGRTALDPARMSEPVTEQNATYVALSPENEAAAWEEAPTIARDARSWRKKYIASGHWPMISKPDATVYLIADEIRHYGSQ